MDSLHKDTYFTHFKTILVLLKVKTIYLDKNQFSQILAKTSWCWSAVYNATTFPKLNIKFKSKSDPLVAIK